MQTGLTYGAMRLPLAGGKRPVLQSIIRRKPAGAETVPRPSDPPQKRQKGSQSTVAGVSDGHSAEPQQPPHSALGGASVVEGAQHNNSAAVEEEADGGEDGGGLTALLGEYGSDSDAS